MAKKQLQIASQIDAATDFEDLKRRLREILHIIESHFESKGDIFFTDQQTNTDPQQYKKGDIIFDSSIIDNAIVVYAYDTKLNKLPISLQGLAGSLPVADNEIFIGNGSNKNFNTLFAFTPDSPHVYLAGLRQRRGTDYTENVSTNKQIQFVVAPPNASIIVIDYQMATIL